MLVTLIGKNSINRIRLPKEKMGNYWLYDKDYNRGLINIVGIDNEWQVKSNNYYRIINNKNILLYNNSITVFKNGHEVVDKIVLKEYNFYYVTIGNSDEVYAIYCSPIYEDNYKHLHIGKTSTICIGRDENENQIVYNNPLVCNKHAKLFFFQGVWNIENYDKKFNTYVNDIPVSSSTVKLYNGDRISILGMTIIIINRELYVNNSANEIVYDLKYFEPIQTDNKVINTEDEEDFSKYVNSNYFYRTPKMTEQLNNEEISIAVPMIDKKSRDLPAVVVLGTSFSMAAMTMISISQTLSNLSEGKTSFKSAMYSLAMSGTMLLTSILIPVLNRHYTKKIDRLNRKDTIENYKKYIAQKEIQIEEVLNYNREILKKTYVNEEECMKIILRQTARLWERQITDKDFLTIRLGMGDIESGLTISSNKSENIEENKVTKNLEEECIKKASIMTNAPVLLSLVEKRYSALLCSDKELKYKYIQNIILQLVTFQSYDELKIIFLLKDNEEKQWDFAKMLPHVWSNSKEMRFFADDKNKINIITEYLEEEWRKRNKEDDEKKTYKNCMPYYLIIIDDYKNVENIEVISEILKSKNNLGFSILFVTDNILKLPNECVNLITIEPGKGAYLESSNINNTKQDFEIDTSGTFSFEKISQVLSNILIKFNDEKEMMLPSSYTFLEMYNVGCIDQIHILERWRENDTTVSLSAPVGIDGTGKLISLDIHEKFHGPHGLIAGSTGSGKSEFIITYILSLAVNYHPDDVTFVLIDYKGGGLAGAFKRPDVVLPHLVGTITNIDKSSLQRSLESIESELKQRQIKFSEASVQTGESTMDIYKYQKYYHNGILKEPISHLFIISDEFAELKQQEPEFMDELISIARIGRSLGVHLILATQKPAGIVNDQIRSNSKFGVCLKVQDNSDSKDIIGIPDAAKLKNAGQFYLKVGNDDYLALGQSAWSGALYYPSDEVKKEFDNSIEFISSTGKVIKKVDDIKKNVKENKGEQLANIVRYISDLAKMKNIVEKPLWLPQIPETIYLKDVRKKYKVKTKEDIINPVIGEYDDPSRQLQNVLTLNLSTGGNTVIYGNAVSGKETLLETMIYDIIDQYSSEQVWLYILDFGSETMKIFKESAHVGDVIFSNEGEKIARLFIMLQKEVKERKEILSKYNGNHDLYTKETGNVMPLFVIILNNYEAFDEAYNSTYDEILETLLREGIKYKIMFVFTTSTTSGMRYRMLQSIRQKISLQMNKDEDYFSIFEKIGKKRPANLFGRGIVNPEEKKYYEFQTAKICEPANYIEQINKVIEASKKEKIKAKEILTVPSIVTVNSLLQYIIDSNNIPIGITHKNITPFILDFTKNLINLIISDDLDEYKPFILGLIEIAKNIPNINITILDAENILQKEKQDVKKDYIELFKKLNNTKKLKENLIIIIGLEKFITELGNEVIFGQSLENAEELEKCNYIIIETNNKMNNYTYSDWYKKYIDGEYGLWLGNGVNEQCILKPSILSNNISSTCGSSYGYVFVKGKPYLVKLLGMKENNEDNE